MMELLDRERLSNGDYFLYFGVFVLVAWPAIMLLGLLDTFLIDNPEDNLTQYNFVAGIAAGAVGALTLAAVRRRKALAAGSAKSGYRPTAKKKSSSELKCPNCGYDGPPIADVQGKLICAMCSHQIAQEASRFRPVQLEAFAGPDPVPTASEGEWFFSREGRPLQPASFEKLTRLVAAGKLKPSDLVWKEGMASWKRIADLPGLFPAEESRPSPGAGTAGKGAGKRSRKASESWLHALAAVPHLVSPVSTASKSGEDEWYYIAGQEAMPHGPVTFVELCRRAADGQVKPTDLVLGQGSEWKEARFVANLFRKGRA